MIKLQHPQFGEKEVPDTVPKQVLARWAKRGWKKVTTGKDDK